MSKILAHSTNKSNGNDFNFDTDLTTLNSKLVDKTIIFCSNKLDSSVTKTIDCRSNPSTH